MRRVIKNQKKMKDTMYIVFGVFALALFGVTMWNPSYAEEGLIIDDALDVIVEQTIPSDNVSEEDESEASNESLDEEATQPEIVSEEKVVKGDENSQDLEDDEENNEHEENLDGEEVDNGENDENEDGDEEGKTDESDNSSENEEVDNEPELQIPEVPSDGESHGVGDNENLNNDENVLFQEDEEIETGFLIDKLEETKEIMTESSATLLPGQDFNKKIKSLATGTTVNYIYIKDYLVSDIQRASEIPQGVTTGLISASNSSNEVIGWYSDGTLYYYTQADTVYLNKDSSNMFSYMNGFESIDLSDFDTSNVENMYSMFGNMLGLRSLDLSSFNTSKVTSMERMFESMENIEMLDLSSFDTSKVTTMQYMFYQCKNLRTIYASSGFLTNVVTSSAAMFDQDKKLVGGKGTKYNGSNSSLIYARIDSDLQSGFFTDKDSIYVNFIVEGDIFNTQIMRLGESVNRPENPIKEGSDFLGWVDENGNEYDFTNSEIREYTELYARFDNSDMAVLVPGERFNLIAKSLAKGSQVTSYYTIDTLITDIQRSNEIPSGVVTGLVSLPYSNNEVIAWYKNGILYYYSQADIIYLNSDSSYMFSYMKGLTSLDLRNFDTSIVENMYGMFYYCENLAYLDLSKFNTSKVTNMGYMFNYIKKITSLDVSNFDTRNVINMGYMFGSCDLLETIYAGTGFITDQVVSSSSMYYYDHKLKGGNGTQYSVYATNTDKSKAKFDTKTQSGYFTDPNEITVNFKLFGNIYESQVVIKGDILSVLDGPEIEGYEFKGRYSDLNFTSEFDFTHGIEKYTEIYAKMDGDEAILLPGTDFNIQIKKLANGEGVSQVTTEDLKINTIVRTGSRESGVTEKIISTSYSKYPVYAWYKDVGGTGTIYYYTEASKIYMNQDSSNMFYYMKGLKELDVSKFDSSRVENMSSMFACKQGTIDGYGIENLTGLEAWDTSKVEDMSYMFARCSNYRKIDISSFNTTNLKKMSNMFIECTNLDTLIMDNKDFTNLYYWSQGILDYNSWDRKPKIKTISARNWKVPESLYKGSDFRGWEVTTLETLDVTNWDTSNVTDMYELFYYLKGLKRIIGLETWDVSNVKNMSEMFRHVGYNSGVEILNVSGWNVSNVENMYEMFASVGSGKIDISGWQLDNIKNMKYMFQGSNVKEVNMSNVIINNPNEDTGTHYSDPMMYGMFQSCSNLEKVDMSNSYMGNGTKLNFLFQSLSSLKEVDFHGADLSNIKSMNAMFQSSGVTGVNFSGARTNKVVDMDYMFQSTSYLKNIIGLEGFDVSNVETMQGMFMNSGIPRLNLSGWNLNKIKDMQYMFERSRLEEINMTNMKINNTGGITNIYGMFRNNYYLKKIDMTNLDISSVRNLSYLFENLSSLDELIGLEGLDTSNIESMKGMFRGVKLLTGLDLSNFDTRNVTDMHGMFNIADGIKTIYVGKNFNTSNVTDSEDMFSGAVSLVGGRGTTYNENHIDKEYAKIDVLGDPGYFTQGEFDIKYNLDGGELENKKISYKIQESFTIQEPVREEAVFLGWSGSNGNVLQKQVNIQKGTTGDLEFTANWKINKYKIIFDTDGGNEISPIEKDYNSIISITLPTPTKECNSFSGWNAELPGTMPAHNITLKAKWNYTCSRSSGGGRKLVPDTSEMDKQTETTAKIAIENEHNSATDDEKGTSDTDKPSLNEETSKEVISVTQEIAEDGTEAEVVVEAVAIKNTNIVATVRTKTPVNGTNSISSSSSTHTKEQADAYSFAKSNGITTTESIEEAKMNTELTRIQMAKMLSNFAINVLGQEPDTEKGVVKFDDVTNKMDKQYDNAVTKAYQLGIMGQNVKNNEFRPNDEVTRAEFASALSRLLYQTEEGEYKGTGKYYVPHVAKLYNEGIINKADPKIKEKRGYVMTMLKRTVE